MLRVIFPESEIAKIPKALAKFENTKKVMASWAGAVAEQCRKNALEKGGRSFWRREVAGSVRTDLKDVRNAEVYSDSYIAEHVEKGGIIRPKNAKMLAIPIDKSVQGEYASDQTDLFIIRNKQKNQVYLARETGQKRKKVKILYVLKSSVLQRPRPWWITDNESEKIGQQEMEWWLNEKCKETNEQFK